MKAAAYGFTLALLAAIPCSALAQGAGTAGGTGGPAAGTAPATAPVAPGAPGTTGPTHPGPPRQVTGNPAAPIPGQSSPLPPQMQNQGSTLPGGRRDATP